MNTGYLPGLYDGTKIIEDPNLPNYKIDYSEVSVSRSFKERWIEPLFSLTLPFEPWVKFKIVTKSRQVINEKVYNLNGNIIMSVEMAKVFRKYLASLDSGYLNGNLNLNNTQGGFYNGNAI